MRIVPFGFEFTAPSAYAGARALALLVALAPSVTLAEAVTGPGNAGGARLDSAPPSPTAETISMDFPDPTPLDVVARHLAHSIGANLVVAPNAPRITLVAPRPVDRVEALALFEAALDSAGWRLVRAGPVYRVVPAGRR